VKSKLTEMTKGSTVAAASAQEGEGWRGCDDPSGFPRRGERRDEAAMSTRELPMHMPSGRTLRLAVTTFAFAGLIVAVNAAPAAATPPNNFVGTVLGRGTLQSNGSVPINAGLDIVVAQNTVQPGGSSGWHSHPGGAIVVVAQGQITTYESVGGHCVITTYTAGQAFTERADKALIAKNTGSTVTVVIATFPNVPVGVANAQRTDLPNPGTCPGV